MHKLLWLILLVGGIVLLVYGVRASDSYGAGLTNAFTGPPTTKAVILLISGLILTLVGLGGLLRHRGS